MKLYYWDCKARIWFWLEHGNIWYQCCSSLADRYTESWVDVGFHDLKDLPDDYQPTTPLYFLLLTGQDLFKSLQDAGISIT
jgi:hypothetical protein